MRADERRRSKRSRSPPQQRSHRGRRSPSSPRGSRRSRNSRHTRRGGGSSRSRSRSYSASPRRRHHSRSRSRHSRERYHHSSSSSSRHHSRHQDRRGRSRTPSRDRNRDRDDRRRSTRERESSRDRDRGRERERERDRSYSRERLSRRRSTSYDDRRSHYSGAERAPTSTRDRSHETTRRRERSGSSRRKGARVRASSSSSPSSRRRRHHEGNDGDDGKSGDDGSKNEYNRSEASGEKLPRNVGSSTKHDTQGSRDKSNEHSSERGAVAPIDATIAVSSSQPTTKDLNDLRNEEARDDAKRNVAVAVASSDVTAEQQSIKVSNKDNVNIKLETKDSAPQRAATPLAASSACNSARRSFDETLAKHTPVHHASALTSPTPTYQSGRSRGFSDAGEPARNGAHGGGSGAAGSKSGSTPLRSSSFTIANPYAQDSKQSVHSVHPVLDPALEKLRDARRESWRAYLKSSSEFNRAQMKYVALEADLEIAEFWLEMMTTNLEDVGKRIEIHDWNYQKAREQEELE